MRTETTIKAVDSIALVSRRGRKVNGLFRLLTNPEVLWKQAYANIYPNKGAITEGVSNNTLDGFSEERVNHLIHMLAKRQYCPTPVRRTYIPKKNGKLRPLGIPTGDDKLVQEVIRIVLEQIYEPIFSENSHGFRPEKSCHTALQQVAQTWTGIKWIIEFDIKKFFDTINHCKMVSCLEKKIDDKRIIDIIRKMLNAGYMEEWRYHSTWSGTPQGGVISPLLANIYLHELDMFMENMIAGFNSGKTRKRDSNYALLDSQMQKVDRKLSRLRLGWKRGTPPIHAKEELLQERRKIQEMMHKTPSVDYFDPNYRRLRYVRYADDFIIGVTGTKEEAEIIMATVRKFIEKELLLGIAEEKSCIKRAKDGVRFLGYDIKSYSSDKLVKIVKMGKAFTKRTMAERIQLHVPAEKMFQYAGKKDYGDIVRLRAKSRPGLLHRSDVEILLAYNAEIRGIVNYYSLATGYKKSMNKLVYLARLSFFATLADKHKSSTAKIAAQLRLPNGGGHGIRIIKNDKPIIYKLFRLKDHVPPKTCIGTIDAPWSTAMYTTSRTEIVRRLNANCCEYCGQQGGYMEIHHVRAMKDVWGKKQLWQQIMSTMNRKTMVLCVGCHKELHGRGLPNWRAKVI